MDLQNKNVLYKGFISILAALALMGVESTMIILLGHFR